MDRLHKNSHRSSSPTKRGFLAKTATTVVAVAFAALAPTGADAKTHPKPKAGAAVPSERPSAKLETYKDLIHKAQNLTLQRDRLQTSQVLIRGIRRETKGSPAYKELVRALDELTSVFYTEKAHALFALGESMVASRPKEALEPYQEALRIEDGNTTLLKALARLHLLTSECDKADAMVRTAENVNPYSPEITLLRLQTLDCQKNYDLLAAKLIGHESELESFEKFSRGLQIKEYVRRKDLKKARGLLNTWENQMPDYPEVYLWKWQLADLSGARDRGAAVRYTQLCQNLTPRKRKAYSADVDLCKGKESVDRFLKESGFQPSAPAGGEEDEE